MELKVIDSDGKAAASLEVSPSAFGVDFNEPLVHQVLVAYQAGGRAGTRAQKNRSAVRGGGVKPWRQKGTGRARAGTIRSPIWRGGGKVFPAQNKDFSQKVNRKMYRGAMKAILSELVRQERLFICDGLTGASEPKTKDMVARLHRLGATDVLIVSHDDSNLALAARNLPKVEVCGVSQLNPFSLIAHERVVMSSEVAKQVEAWLQ